MVLLPNLHTVLYQFELPRASTDGEAGVSPDLSPAISVPSQTKIFTDIEVDPGGAHAEPAVELVASHLDRNPGPGVIGHVHDPLSIMIFSFFKK